MKALDPNMLNIDYPIKAKTGKIKLPPFPPPRSRPLLWA